MLLTLADTWVHVHGCDWGVVMLASPRYSAALPNIALIDVEVLGANVEVLLFSFREIQAVRIDLLSVLSAGYRALSLLRCYVGVRGVLRNAEEVERLRVYEHSWPPIAHLSIVTDTHDLVLVVISDD